MFCKNRGINCHRSDTCDCQHSNQQSTNCNCQRSNNCGYQQSDNCPCPPLCHPGCRSCHQPICQTIPPIPPVMPIPSVGFDGLRAYGGKHANKFDEHGTFMSAGAFHTISLDCDEPMRKMFSEGSCLVVEKPGTYLVQYSFNLSTTNRTTITSAVLSGADRFCKNPITSTTLIEEFGGPGSKFFSCSTIISLNQPCTPLSLGIMSNTACVSYTVSGSSARITAIKLD